MLMTESEFFRNALLQIAGNSAFGSHKRGSYYSFYEWAKDIVEAATELTALAMENQCVEGDRPKLKKPP